MLRADDRAQLGRWDEVREALAPCTAASFADDEDHAQHFHHLLALAALHRGDVQTLREQLAEAEQAPGVVQPPGALRAAPARGRARDDEDAEGACVPLAELVWTAPRADARLDAGDPEGALAALDPQRFYGRRRGAGPRPAGRGLAPHLAGAPPAAASRRSWRWRLRRGARRAAVGPREGAAAPGGDLGRDRLDDLARRASAWLDAQARGTSAGAGGTP